ncbi:tyrosine-type recombinase/integrase [Rhizobium daejeonense]|uniref:Tyrosine-type recombinase/integrase n=1 Tax=Rhizobium daejeonense TaxID=240521 RepID=A0A6M1RXU7_9HYPH|nr:tyrosine-type recombinase/integrase [Rhizobium daejeonense]NGO63909.1 tyrosine-type recombinase/integrase [Rhizobium daejeonense]
MRAKLKGLMKVKKILASGKTIYYCYAWRGGPLLKTKSGEPMQPGDPMIVKAFAEATKDRHIDPTETLNAIIAEYRGSTDFTGLAEKTRKEYDRYIDKIRDKFGKTPFFMLDDPRYRGELKKWRDTMADKPRTADYAWTTLARLLSFGKDRGKLKINIAEKGGRLYESDRADKIWTDPLLDRILAELSIEMKAGVIMGLCTGQRKSDLLKAPKTDYDGKSIKVKQGKRGARVKVPAIKQLRDALDELSKRQAEYNTEVTAATLLTSSNGTPWTSDGFDTAWQRAMKKANIEEDLTFHDLRGTAVTRLAIAGCSIPQIASITGHSLRDVETILDAHYLGGKAELAEQAMTKLENFQERKKAD